MAILTAEQKEAYLEGGGNECPLCGHEKLTHGHMDGDGHVLWFDVECDSCKGTWWDTYTLTDVNLHNETEED